jgi:gamma-glutamyltranspeptidase/glutathione hydrolase
MPPCQRRGIGLLEMLNVLEGYDLRAAGFGSALTVPSDARPCAAPSPTARATSATRVEPAHARSSDSSPRNTPRDCGARSRGPRVGLRTGVFEWPAESAQTTHLSVVDRDRNAVALTYTLEDNYGSKIVVPGAGFLLNNEMGDFQRRTRPHRPRGLLGTEPNLAGPASGWSRA